MVRVPHHDPEHGGSIFLTTLSLSMGRRVRVRQAHPTSKYPEEDRGAVSPSNRSNRDPDPSTHRQAQGGEEDRTTMLRVMVRYSNHEVLEGMKSFMRSTSPAEEWFAPCNAKLTVSEVTEQPSTRLNLLQHALRGRAYLSFFSDRG